jgi:hypothetical protein
MTIIRRLSLMPLLSISIFVLLNKQLEAATCEPAHAGSMGSTASLIACIEAANMAAEDTVIDLGGAGYTLNGIPMVFTVDGDNALPSINNASHTITMINGSIERNISDPTPNFRILHIAAGATLHLSELTLDHGLIDTGGMGFSNSGGAIFNRGNLVLDHVTLSNNIANDLGGAIFNAATGNVEIKNTSISGNKALDSSQGNGGGGGLYNDGIVTSIERSSIANNITPGFGAGINNASVIGKIMDSVIFSNQVLVEIIGGPPATAAGGGIFNNNMAQITNIINSTIAKNSAYQGGGIFNNGTIGISNATIALNIANNGGGGIFNNNDGVVNELISTIVATNIDTNANPINTPDINNLGSIISEKYNFIGDNAGVIGIINGINNDLVGFDPMLGALQDNGGPTFTLALLPGSLAINNGDNPSSLSYDQRQAPFLRVIDGRPDIGAYEYQGCLDIDNDGVCNEFDNCPATLNPDQLDSDSDSLGDVCDNCPFVANPNQQDIDFDGIGDVCDGCIDVDKDGVGDPGFDNIDCPISNKDDNCPFFANPDQKDLDKDGIGDRCDTIPGGAALFPRPVSPPPVPILPPPPPPPSDVLVPVLPALEPAVIGMPGVQEAPSFEMLDQQYQIDDALQAENNDKLDQSKEYLEEGRGCSTSGTGGFPVYLFLLAMIFLQKVRGYFRSKRDALFYR